MDLADINTQYRVMLTAIDGLNFSISCDVMIDELRDEDLTCLAKHPNVTINVTYDIKVGSLYSYSYNYIN